MKYLLCTVITICTSLLLNARGPVPAGFTAKPSPLYFTENKGQVVDQYGKQRRDIDMKLETPGMNIFIGKGGVHYQWIAAGGQPGAGGLHPADPSLRYAALRMTNGGMQNTTSPLPPELFAPLMRPLTLSSKGELQERDIKAYRMDVELVGADKNAKPVLEEEQEFFEQYYTDWSGEDGVRAHSYRRIIYKNIYPHIDWVLHTNGQGLKYDFVVHPGGDPASIRLRYGGATALGIKEGRLLARTPMGGITEERPYAYEQAGGRAVACSYRLSGQALEFETGSYTGTLVIDPDLQWGTYFGGTAGEGGVAVAVDATGNVYMGGGTNSGSNIATSGAYQTSFASSSSQADGFLVKFNTTGQRIWATYYGGSSGDLINSIAIDANSNIYFSGSTESASGIASTGAYKTVFGGSRDAFLARFNTSGQRIWATYYGGTGANTWSDVDSGVATDAAGNVYLAASTTSTSGIATTGAYQTSLATTSGPQHYDAYLVKFSSAGARQWGTYFGGTDQEDNFTVATDAAGNVYITGTTQSTSGIASSGAHQGSFGGVSDAVLAKFSTGGALLWATYYGGSAGDGSASVACDAQNNVYIGGGTVSNSGIASIGSFKPSISAGGYNDAFIACFNALGVRQWGTYYGGDSIDIVYAVCLDSAGNLMAGGRTRSNNGIATTGAHQTVLAGSQYNAFIAGFDATGARLWGTYYGGGGGNVGDQFYDIAVNYQKDIFVCGGTSSTTGIATTGAFQTSLSGTADAFLAKFNADTLVYINQPFTDTLLCIGDSVHVPYSVTRPFVSGNSFTLQLSNASGSFASPLAIASITATGGGVLHGLIPATVAAGTGYRLRIVASNPARTSNDDGINIRISPLPTATASANTPLCEGLSLNLSGASTTNGVTYSWTGPNSFSSSSQNPSVNPVSAMGGGDYILQVTKYGCSGKDTVTVTVTQPPVKPVAGNNSPICAGAILNLTANTTTPGVTWAWYGPNGFTSTQQNPTLNPAALADSGNYVVTVSLNGCTRSDTTHAEISNTSSIGAYASPNDTFCEGTLATFVAVPFNMGPNPQYQWFKNGNPIAGATNTLYNTSSYATGDSFYCRMIATGVCSTPLTLFTQGIKITVLPITLQPSITISSNPAQPIPGQPVAFTATSVNGGPNPTYQWQRNGQDMTGAVYANWSANNLAPYDKITCIVFSSDVCATPKTDTSDPIVVNFPTGIKDIGENEVLLYPNPTNGNFTVNTKEEGIIYLYDIQGRLTSSYGIDKQETGISLSAAFTPGVYIARFIDENNNTTIIRLVYQP